MDRIIDYIKKFDKDFITNRSWYAGITNNLSKRKKEHEYQKAIKCEFFQAWDCGTEENAQKAEKFLERNGLNIYKKNLKPSTLNASKQDKSKYIYVFKALKIK